MTVAEIGSSVIGALTSGLTGLVSAIPTAIKTTFENLFFDGTGTTQSVSNFAVVSLIFGGIALAFGLSKLVYHCVANKIGA